MCCTHWIKDEPCILDCSFLGATFPDSNTALELVFGADCSMPKPGRDGNLKMHVGVTSHVLGNIIFETMQLGQWGNTFAEQMKQVNLDLNLWYRQNVGHHKIQGKLTIDRIRTKSGWPKLHAKAASTRHLAEYGCSLAVRFNSGSLHDQRRLAIAKLLCKFYEIIAAEGMFLSRKAKSEIKTIGADLVVLYNALSTEAAEQEKKGWKFAPKFHLFVHLCEIQAQYLGNPRFFWTYADEDLVGHLVEVAESCHPSTVAETAMFKHLLLHFE